MRHRMCGINHEHICGFAQMQQRKRVAHDGDSSSSRWLQGWGNWMQFWPTPVPLAAAVAEMHFCEPLLMKPEDIHLCQLEFVCISRGRPVVLNQLV